MNPILAKLIKDGILSALRAKWPDASLEFHVTLNGVTYSCDEWTVKEADVQQKRLVIGLDCSKSPVLVEARKVK